MFLLYLCKSKFENCMTEFFREIGKTCMFAIVWLFPIYLAQVNADSSYLWFFVLSFLMTFGIFGHYEDLRDLEDTDDERK